MVFLLSDFVEVKTFRRKQRKETKEKKTLSPREIYRVKKKIRCLKLPLLTSLNREYIMWIYTGNESHREFVDLVICHC